MISVSLIERTRKFGVYVGQKKVGQVCVYNSGRVSAYGENVDGSKHFLDTHDSLKKAADRILRWEGFGNSIDVRVIRASGGRKR